MSKVSRVVAVAAACLVVMFTVAYAVDAIRGPTAEQSAAAESLRMPASPPGKNAWAVLWSADYDVTPEQAARFYAADRRALPTWLDAQSSRIYRPGEWPRFARAVEKNAPPLTPFNDDDRSVLCEFDAYSCLWKVRTYRAEAEALLQRHARRLAHVESLSAYDVLWSDAPADGSTPIPAMAHVVSLWITAASYRFVAGDHERGLETACASALATRRMHARSNTLIGSMVMDAGFRRSARVVGDMLAELAPNEAVPDRCRQALAEPAPEDVDYAALASYEWEASVRADDHAVKAPWHEVFNPGMSIGALTAFGGSEARRAMIDDTAFDPSAHLSAPPDFLQRVVHPLARTSAIDVANGLTRYLDRGADFVADLRMARLLLWLHDHPSSASLASRLALVPDAWNLPLGRPAVIGCEGRCIAMRERVVLGDMTGPWAVRPEPVSPVPRRLACPAVTRH